MQSATGDGSESILSWSSSAAACMDSSTALLIVASILLRWAGGMCSRGEGISNIDANLCMSRQEKPEQCTESTDRIVTSLKPCLVNVVST